MLTIQDTISFEAGGCTWFQPGALRAEVVEQFRGGLDASGRLWLTFYDWPTPPEPAEFLRILTRDGVLCWFGFDTATREPMAIFWLEMAGATARINFALLPCCFGRRALRVAREVTDAILAAGKYIGLRALMGETPTANTAAVKYAKSCGLRPLGIIMNGCYMAETGEFCGRLITCKTMEG
jgi:hypothetical protein